MEQTDVWQANWGLMRPPAYANGERSEQRTILESLGGGAGVADFDRDGWLDLVLPGGGEISQSLEITGLPTLYLRGAGRQSRPIPRHPVALPPRNYAQGIAAADYDQDGFSDLLITGYGGPQLWRNAGDGTWADVTAEAGLSGDSAWCTSATWGDFDGDGALDVYLCRYVSWSPKNHPDCLNAKGHRDICPPRQFEALPDVLYRGLGDGIFRDASVERGLTALGKGLGVVATDLDLDGDLDLYIGNDSTPNFMYWNNGSGVFREGGLFSGAALNDMGTPDGSMGVASADFDQDGWPDVWVANYERELFALYRNLGKQSFLHVSQGMGIGALGGTYVGFGTVFSDCEGDGDEDLIVSNGHVELEPTNSPLRQLPVVLENMAGERFVNVAAAAGPYFQQPHRGRGLARGDWDRDGDEDLVLSPVNEPAAILENVSPRNGHWLGLRLIGIQGNRDAIGAWGMLTTSRGKRLRQVSGNEGYLSQSDRQLVWAIPAGETVKSLVLHWPGGQIQELWGAESVGLEFDREWIVREQHAPVPRSREQRISDTGSSRR